MPPPSAQTRSASTFRPCRAGANGSAANKKGPTPAGWSPSKHGLLSQNLVDLGQRALPISAGCERQCRAGLLFGITGSNLFRKCLRLLDVQVPNVEAGKASARPDQRLVQVA